MKTDSPITALIESHHEIVQPDWVDGGGRMRTGLYMVVFDVATGGFFTAAGWSRADRVPFKCTVFTLESHLCCERAPRNGDPLRFTTQLIDVDAKRVHYLHEMRHATEGWLAASNELVSMNVNTETRRSAPFPEHLAARFAAIRDAHRALGVPAQVGRAVGLGRAGERSA
ncbi:MAG: thioesterase family protein [Burkholderiaceae bacterium]